MFVHICKYQLEDPPNFLNLHQLSKNKLSKNQLSHEIGPFNNPIGQKNWSPFLQPSKLLQQRFDEETQLLCLGKTSGRPRLQDAVGEVVSMWSATPKITKKKKKPKGKEIRDDQHFLYRSIFITGSERYETSMQFFPISKKSLNLLSPSLLLHISAKRQGL